jgi:hypothetical protein
LFGLNLRTRFAGRLRRRGFFGDGLCGSFGGRLGGWLGGYSVARARRRARCDGCCRGLGGALLLGLAFCCLTLLFCASLRLPSFLRGAPLAFGALPCFSKRLGRSGKLRAVRVQLSRLVQQALGAAETAAIDLRPRLQHDLAGQGRAENNSWHCHWRVS